MDQSECPTCGNQQEAEEVEGKESYYVCSECNNAWWEFEIEEGEFEISQITEGTIEASAITSGTLGAGDETPP